MDDPKYCKSLRISWHQYNNSSNGRISSLIQHWFQWQVDFVSEVGFGIRRFGYIFEWLRAFCRPALLFNKRIWSSSCAAPSAFAAGNGDMTQCWFYLPASTPRGGALYPYIYFYIYIYMHSSRWYIPHMFSILILHLSNVNRFSTRRPPGKVVEMFDSSGWVNPRIPIWQYRLWKEIAKVSGIKIDYPWLSGSSG